MRTQSAQCADIDLRRHRLDHEKSGEPQMVKSPLRSESRHVPTAVAI